VRKWLWAIRYFPSAVQYAQDMKAALPDITVKNLNKSLDKIKSTINNLAESIVIINYKINDINSDIFLIKRLALLNEIKPGIVSAVVPGIIKKIDIQDFCHKFIRLNNNSCYANAISEELFHISEYALSITHDEAYQLALYAIELAPREAKAKRCGEAIYIWFLFRYYFENINILQAYIIFLEMNDWSDDLSFYWALCIFAILEENDNNDECIRLLNKHNDIYMLRDIDRILPLSFFANQHGFSNEKIEKSSQLFSVFEQNQNNKLLQNFIVNKKIAIVGNGPSQLGKHTGEEIDSHDIVIRFNGYNTDGLYIEDYGKKTDIWNANFVAIHQPPHDFANIDYVFYPESSWNFIIENNTVDRLLEYNKSKILLTYSKEDKINFCKEIKIRQPTNGLKMLFYIKNMKNDLQLNDIYGFSIETEKNDRFNGHYYNFSDIRTDHNLCMESKIIIKLFNS
jgi:hypothetical protein